MKNLIIIPTYNEAENVENLINALDVLDCDILFIDDSSPDGTSNLIRQHKKYENSVYLIERIGERGYASACKAGFNYGLTKNYKNIIQMDSDFSHSVDDLKNMLSYAASYDLIIGSRYIFGGKTSGWGINRVVLSRIANLFSKWYLDLSFNDLTSGFRIYNTKILRFIELNEFNSEGYGFLVEILYKLSKKGILVKEVPIHFNDRKFGKSKMSASIIIDAIKLVIFLRFSK